MGEDVEHGGYYLVTDALAKKFPNRVRDFPPDETTLVGAGMGFAQAGLIPIVEIPGRWPCGSQGLHRSAAMCPPPFFMAPGHVCARLQDACAKLAEPFPFMFQVLGAFTVRAGAFTAS